MNDKIFINGFYSNDVPDTLPDFILGKGSLHIEKLTKFMEENKQYAVDGYLNYTILKSKEAGNRYVQLDLYKYNKQQEELDKPSPKQPSADEIDVSDIPF